MDMARQCSGASSSGRAWLRRARAVRAVGKSNHLRTTVTCRAASGESGTQEPATKRTISNLDALLGIEDEKKAEAAAAEREATSSSGSEPDAEAPSAVMAEQIRGLKQANQLATMERLLEERRKRAAEGLSEDARDVLKKATESGEMRAEDAVRLAQEFLPDGNVTNEVVQVIKRDILGMSTFLVTDVEFLKDEQLGGVKLSGNLRVSPTEVKTLLQDELRKRYGDRYMVYLMRARSDEAWDDGSDEFQEDGNPRVALRVVPTLVGAPNAFGPIAIFAAIVLFALTGASMLSLAAAVSLPKLPPETLAWLSAAADGQAMPSEIPGLDDSFNALPFLGVFARVFAGLVAVSAAHELGHRAVARFRGIRLGPSLYIPNGSLGTFGAVTRPESAFKSRDDLWDVVVAGPIAGLTVSGALFAYGLLLSIDPSTDPAGLVSVPSGLFSGSVVLGGLCELAFGSVAPAGKWLVHPLLIAGWCGLFTQAFNVLPVGALDGGKMMQSAYGRSALTFSAILVYIGLTFGFIGGQLAFPFALFVLIAQREPERYIQDEVTEVAPYKRGVTATLVFIALLVLIPYSLDAPQLLDSIESNIATEALQATFPQA